MTSRCPTGSSGVPTTVSKRSTAHVPVCPPEKQTRRGRIPATIEPRGTGRSLRARGATISGGFRFASVSHSGGVLGEKESEALPCVGPGAAQRQVCRGQLVFDALYVELGADLDP